MGKGYSKSLGRKSSVRYHGGESSEKEVKELEEVKLGMTPYITDEVLTNILIKLPAKSLARFKCVCKNWCSLFQDKAFVYSHLACNDRSVGYIRILYPDEAGWFRFYSIDGHGSQTEMKFRANSSNLPISSCDGLFCFADTSGMKLCNPVTGETMTIPNPSCFRTCLAGKLMTGFGFDVVSRKYKIVCCTNLSNQVEVLTLGCLHSTWRYINHPLGLQIPIAKPTYANGNLYWIIASIIDTGTRSKKCMILTFSLTDEKFRVLAGPDENFWGFNHWLSVLECYLCVVQAHSNRTVNLWILKDDEKDLWVKKFAFQLPFPRIPLEDFMTVGINKVLFRSTENSCSYVCHYGEQSQLLKVIKVEGLPSSLRHHMGYHVESLISLRFISEI